MFMEILDFLTIAGGLALIVAPGWAYNFGRKEPAEVPKSWAVTSRVAGVFFLLLGLVFIYFNYFR